MRSAIVLAVALFALSSMIDAQHRPGQLPLNAGKVVCYYNSSSFIREGLGKMTVADLEPALSFCNHLIYGWAGIDPTNNKLRSLNEGLDLDSGKGHYRTITQLKRKYPGLKVLLGVGGGADPSKDIYLQLLESSAGRITFINSVYTMLKTYDFDGLDLGWQFKPNKPKRIRSSVGSFWYSTKKLIGAAGKALDEKAPEHKEGYTALVRELKNAFRADNYQLTMTVLPNVNTTLFFDVPGISPNLDLIQLGAFDYQTWERNPYEADFAAPIYELNERYPESNVNFQVHLWSSFNVPRNKLIVVIPTHGRSWALTEDSTKTGVPPILEVENPGPEGIQTKQAGLLSWPEVCSKLPNPSNQHLKGEQQPLRKVGDPTKRFGTYAYRLPDTDGNYGLWITYEDPETAANKAEYVTKNGLGGIGIFDLSNDDFRGTCTGDKFPILRASKFRLSTQ